MNRCTRTIPAWFAWTVMPALMAPLLLLLTALQVQAEPASNLSLHPEWNIPKGSYIEKFCPDHETRKSCLTEVVNYDEASDLLYIDLYLDGYQYAFEIISPCSYVEAGFDLYPMISRDEDTSELWVYAEGASDRKYTTVNRDGSHLEDLFLDRLTNKKQVGKSCELKYYPDHDFLVGDCKNKQRNNVFVMMEHFKERAVLAMEKEAGSLMDATADNYIIENLDGQLRLLYCSDVQGSPCYTKEDVYVTTTSESCAEKEMDAVKIKDRWFCHDSTIDKKYIKIAGCKKKTLAIDTTENLLIAECRSGSIRYLPNPTACLEASLKFSRVRGTGELLGCELIRSKGIAVAPTQKPEDATEQEAETDDSADNQPDSIQNRNASEDPEDAPRDEL